MTPCPKCQGLVVPDSDRHGSYLHCMTCGWVDLPALPYLTAKNEKFRVLRQHTHQACERCTIMTLENTISALERDRSKIQAQLDKCRAEIAAADDLDEAQG